jgi:hypothetical protein
VAADVEEFLMQSASTAALSTAALSAPARTDEIAAQLDTVRNQIETRFADAGSLLADTLDVIGRLIEALNRLSGALTAETATETMRNLLATADGLHALPERYAQRQAHLMKLSEAGDALRGPVEEMRRLLKYLRVFTLNVKITSGGIETAAEDFAAFADSMLAQLDVGGGQLTEFYDQLNEIDRQLRTTLTAERSLSAQCVVLIPHAPDRLAADARSVDVHHKSVAQIAASTAALAQKIQGRVGEALAALQIGDITRQRIEHVQTGLKVLSDVSTAVDTQGDARDRLSRPVLHMLADQMSDISADFAQQVERLTRNLSGLASDSSEVLRLREVAGGTGQARGQLDDLADSIAQAVTLVRDLRSATESADAFSRSTRSTVEGLMQRVATIRSVREDIQMMSTNTHLRCNRLGEPGKPLGVIASELTSHARQLEASADITLGFLRELDAIASVDAPSSASGGTLDEYKLEDSARLLRAANDVVEKDIHGLAGSGAGLAATLAQTQRRLDFGRELGGLLDAATNQLAEMAGPDARVCEDIATQFAEVMDRTAVVYTMARERVVHAAHAPLRAEVALAPAESADIEMF